jgi:hypothetical protein
MQKILMSSQGLGDALLETKRCASETVGVSRPELLVLLQNLFADGSMANLRALITSQVAGGEGVDQAALRKLAMAAERREALRAT